VPTWHHRGRLRNTVSANHLAHFLLFQLLKPTLLASSTPDCPSRVVVLSSCGHRFAPVNFEDPNCKITEYNKWAWYGQAKTANIWMATEIERRYGARGLHASAVHPGGALSF
jgi:NAD(P)-dependent dehydrogenase (short-subunit alcohol dehydrogenase family)